MKTKIISVVVGAINGGFLCVVPLLLYDYLLNKNLDMPSGTDIALRGTFGVMFLVFIVNAITFTWIYKLGARESPNARVFLFVFIGWVLATAVLAFIGRSIIFLESESNIEGAFSILCSIINFVSIIMATIIAKLAIKIITKNQEAEKKIQSKTRALLASIITVCMLLTTIMHGVAAFADNIDSSNAVDRVTESVYGTDYPTDLDEYRE